MPTIKKTKGLLNAGALGEIPLASLGAISNGQGLVYNSTTKKFEAGAVSGGSSIHAGAAIYGGSATYTNHDFSAAPMDLNGGDAGTFTEAYNVGSEFTTSVINGGGTITAPATAGLYLAVAQLQKRNGGVSNHEWELAITVGGTESVFARSGEMEHVTGSLKQTWIAFGILSLSGSEVIAASLIQGGTPGSAVTVIQDFYSLQVARISAA